MGDEVIYLAYWFSYDNQSKEKAFRDLEDALKYKDELLAGRKCSKYKEDGTAWFHIDESQGVLVKSIPYVSDAR